MSQDVETRLQALEAKIQDLSDREAIRSLRFRYHECINGEELDAIAGLFTEDAELTVQTAHVTHRGHDEIRRMFNDFMRDTPVIYHGEFGHVVDVDNQLVASQFLARNDLADGSVVAMRNCNFFVLREGRFAKVTIYMSGDNPLV